MGPSAGNNGPAGIRMLIAMGRAGEGAPPYPHSDRPSEGELLGIQARETSRKRTTAYGMQGHGASRSQCRECATGAITSGVGAFSQRNARSPTSHKPAFVLTELRRTG